MKLGLLSVYHIYNERVLFQPVAIFPPKIGLATDENNERETKGQIRRPILASNDSDSNFQKERRLEFDPN